MILALWVFAAMASQAEDRRVLQGHVPAAMKSLAPAGSLPDSQRLRLAVGLPLRDQPGLRQLLQQIYDPASPQYHHYLTPEQFTQAFGPTQQDYEEVAAFAKANGLEVAGMYSNRLLIDVAGPVPAIEKAFNLRLRRYQHPTENRTFYAPDAEPSVPSHLAILDIDGLNNFTLPHPKFKRQSLAAPTPASKQGRAKGLPGAPPRDGSGPSGTYMGSDFRAAYIPGISLTGAGQTVGLLQFDGYTPSDISNYITLAGLSNVTLTNVLLDGYDGTPTGNGGEVEVSLDIEMTISMAPGISLIMVYEAGPFGSPNDILNQMAVDDAAQQLSCSWGWSGGPTASIDQIFQQMDAQGQTFYNASGDSDAFCPGSLDDPSLDNSPSDNPYITQVGGTTLTTSGPGGSWVSETVWQWGGGTGSSGGISSYYPIPTWQSTVTMSANGGSTSLRNTPDVALTADNVIVIADGQQQPVGGTSCAAPLWAAFTALVNEQGAITHQPPVGFFNPALYNIGLGSSYSSAFHDITTGNNFNDCSPSQFSAVAGYDLATGWGTPTAGLIDILAPPDSLRISPPAGFATVGDPHGPFGQTSQAYSLTNAGAAALTWSLGNTNPWLSLAPLSGALSPGGPATKVTASLNSVASNLPPGTYSGPVRFTNQSDSVVQDLQFSVVVLGAPVITAEPTNQTVRTNQSATFSVSAIGAPPLSYFWLHNSNLVAGATQTNFTFQSAQLTDSGSQFSCIVSNAYGSVTSQVAVLTVVSTLLLNGGFETGDFSDWTEFGNLEDTLVTTNAEFVHSGNYGAALGPVGSLGFISQTLPTAAGGTYLVSLWLVNSQAGVNEFQVSWNDENLFDSLEMPVFSWTNLQLIAWAPGTNSTLQIGFRNDPYYFGLDDISVQPTPPVPPTITSEPVSQSVTAGATVAFTVGVSGSGPLYYHWHFGNAALSGATNQTLTLTNVTMQQTGAYFVLVSNSLGSATSSVALLSFAPTNLIGNGGFETGDFTDWTLDGDPGENYVGSDPGYVHSGNYAAELGESDGLAFLSQSVPTVSGGLYLFSFWLANPELIGGPGYNEFQASWNSAVLFDQVNLGPFDFTNLQFLVTASGPSTTVQFGSENDADYFALDDVSVVFVPLPNFQGATFSSHAISLEWATTPGLQYQIQYTSDLHSQEWTNLGGVLTATSDTLTATDPAVVSWRFYRIILLSP